jgi:hypothetical protein
VAHAWANSQIQRDVQTLNAAFDGAEMLKNSGRAMSKRLTQVAGPPTVSIAEGLAFHWILSAFLFVGAPALAEPPRALQAQDYGRAEQFMPYKTAPLVWNTAANVSWLPSGKLWYLTVTSHGNDFVLIDPVRRTRQPLFDQSRQWW